MNAEFAFEVDGEVIIDPAADWRVADRRYLTGRCSELGPDRILSHTPCWLLSCCKQGGAEAKQAGGQHGNYCYTHSISPAGGAISSDIRKLALVIQLLWQIDAAQVLLL